MPRSLIDKTNRDLWQAAVRPWEAALHLDPLNEAALINLATYHYAVGDLDEAAELYGKAASIPSTLNAGAYAQAQAQALSSKKVMAQGCRVLSLNRLFFSRHPRAGGDLYRNSVCTFLDSRLRGNDGGVQATELDCPG